MNNAINNIQKKINFTNIPFLFYAFLICYLLINTGIISDDFQAMVSKSKSYFIETPVQYLTNYIWYKFISIDSQVILSMLKIFFILLSFFLIAKFFSIYLDKHNAFLASFLFIFFPSHDSTVYCFMIQYLTLSFAFYLYSFYLAYRNRLFLAFLFAVSASFVSYGSTPIAISLFALFLLNKEFKKGAVIIIPNIIYCFYFIPLNIFLRIGSPRIIEKLSIPSFIKQFILQILSFPDAMFGPSMWLKIYYSFQQISFLSLVIGAILAVLIYRACPKTNEKYDKKIVLSFIILLCLSFLIYSFTGRYPQIAFNLGNRVTIFGSLLLTYLIILAPVSKKIRTLIICLMILTTLGISDHWKKWQVHQQQVITNIRNNVALKNYSDIRFIYVSGNQYSQYGPISHIEFFSENWVPSAVLNLALERNIEARSINKRHLYKDGYLVDRKYNTKTEVTDYINIYDSQNDSLFSLTPEAINSYIDGLPFDTRHWAQILDIKFIRDIAETLMPRLKYSLRANSKGEQVK